MAHRVLMLALWVAAMGGFGLQIADAAPIAEVKLGLARARQSKLIGISATTYVKVLTSRWGRFLNFGLPNAPITILIPSNYIFTRYQFRRLTTPQTLNVLNFNIIKGRWTFAQLVNTKYGVRFLTNFQNRPIFKNYYPRQAQLKINGAAAGKRSVCEMVTAVVQPNIYIGPHVAVHGVSCLLTPPTYAGGPYVKLFGPK